MPEGGTGAGDPRPPRFAVVGHPNKGKSSIVSTLAEDVTVTVGAKPGTTRGIRSFPMQIDGRTLYELTDTPGFQRARAVLGWLQQHDRGAARRRETVQAFVDQHRDDPRFTDEVALLTPLLEGAGILYVVDGSRPYGPSYESEMEILRWTGQPRMALINLIGDGDHKEAWERALGQYFSMVRVFDAQKADFRKRIELLRAFGQLCDAWREPLAAAADELIAERRHRLEQSAAEIAALLVDAYTSSLTRTVPFEADAERERDALAAALKDRIRAREAGCRARIQALYGHARLRARETAALPVGDDLFSEQSWQVFGLTRAQLVSAAALGGAAAGGAVDLLAGGASLFIGAGLGALAGGTGAAFGGRQLARTRVAGLRVGGRVVSAGPVTDPNLGWVLANRALLHHRLISERNHARRDALVLADGAAADEPEGDGRSTRLTPKTAPELARLLTRLAGRRAPDPGFQARLTAVLVSVLEMPDGVSGDPAAPTDPARA